VIPRVGGGEIRLQVVVPPEEADDWAEQVDEAVTALETREIRADVFEAHLRQYRGRRMLELLNPEDRAGAAARELLVTGRFDGLLPDLTEMTPGRVREAARSLSQPTLMILGPSLN
jgi:predicted Zn-dependent peptidase